MALIKCSECGKEISDKATACPNCGCPVETGRTNSKSIDYSDRYRNPANQKTKTKEPTAVPVGPHCPHCGSQNLQAISDVTGKGASFWKLCFCGFLGLCGTGKTKTTHYWVCKDCGYKFKI